MNFLFDLVNHAAGYTEKYYDEQREKITEEGLIAKYRKDKKKYANNLQESPLLGDRYAHCLLVIEGVHELYRMNPLAQDYLDTMILRLNVSLCPK